MVAGGQIALNVANLRLFPTLLMPWSMPPRNGRRSQRDSHHTLSERRPADWLQRNRLRSERLLLQCPAERFCAGRRTDRGLSGRFYSLDGYYPGETGQRRLQHLLSLLNSAYGTNYLP